MALAVNWGFTHLLKSYHITTAAGGSRAFREVHHKQGHDLGETWGYNQSLTNLNDPKNVAETTASPPPITGLQPQIIGILVVVQHPAY
jgi:hypothetical protein